MLRALLLASAAALFGSACPTPIQNDDDAGPGGDDGGVQVCIDDEQCGGGFCLNGVCSAAECVSKATCLASEVCKDGRCVPPPATCASSDDCPGIEACDGFSNSCFDPNNPSGEGEGDAGEGEGDAGEGEGEGDAGEGEGEGEGDGTSFDLSGFVVQNRQNNPVNQAAVFPGGTVLFAGHTLVIGRDATKAEFEGHWGALPATTLYLNGNNGGVPIVNGDETWALVDPNGQVVDGPTIVGDTATSYQRTAAGSAATASNWATAPDTDATPGVTALPAGSGLKISEWSDASGNGNFVFEFLEISWQP